MREQSSAWILIPENIQQTEVDLQNKSRCESLGSLMEGGNELHLKNGTRLLGDLIFGFEWSASGVHLSLIEYTTWKTDKASFWPWSSGQSALTAIQGVSSSLGSGVP